MNSRLAALIFAFGCATEPEDIPDPPDVCVGDDTGRHEAACRAGGTADDVSVALVVKDAGGPCATCTSGVAYVAWLVNPCDADITVDPFDCLVDSKTIDGITVVFSCTGATPDEHTVVVPALGRIVAATGQLSTLEAGPHEIEVAVSGVGSAGASFCVE